MKRLENKVAVVTGATSGIGEAVARLFAKEGAKVVFCGRRQDLGDKIAAEIAAEGGEVTFVKADVAVDADIDNLVKTVIDKYGRINVLIPNAGTSGECKPFEQSSVEDFDYVTRVNFRSYYYLCRQVIPYMLDAGKGSIVMTSSVATIMASPTGEAYCGSKAGVAHMAKSLAIEYAARGIRVNVVMPGAITTGFIPAGCPAEAYYINRMPVKRMGTAEECANAYLFLASDEASLITGVLLPVDGAMSLPV